MESGDLVELKASVADLMGNTHNLEISLLASSSRLSLVEAFNSQIN